jgi:hypothetical protein
MTNPAHITVRQATDADVEAVENLFMAAYCADYPFKPF